MMQSEIIEALLVVVTFAIVYPFLSIIETRMRYVAGFMAIIGYGIA